MTITVMYSCLPCGARKVTLEVPARGDEGVVAWMNLTVRRVADDHRAKFPGCTATTLSELWVPSTGRSKVGGPVEH